MNSLLDTILKYFAPLSEQYGTGDPRGDLSLVLVVLLVLGGLLLSLIIIFGNPSRRKKGAAAKKSGEGFDRYAGLAGKFERLEMNFNNSRTEVLREVELLKARVQILESRAGVESPVEAVVEEEVQSSESDDLGQPFGGEQELIDEIPGPLDSASKPRVSSGRVSQIDDTAPEPKTVLVPSSEMEDVRQSVIDEEASPEQLSEGLTKTRRGIFQRIREVFSGKPSLSSEMVEELQAFLVSTDLGVRVVRELTDELREEVSRGEEYTEEKLLKRLEGQVQERLRRISGVATPLQPIRQNDGPMVILMVGVNGVGKTTTTAKLASKWKKRGARILLVAADTFRAAAVEQLKRWGDELDIPVQLGAEGAKPSTVVFDAMERTKQEEFDVVIIDTAGRLHTKGNLMQELEGIRNAVQRHQIGAPHEVLLVIDGTTGQNALQQAKEFDQAISLTGLVVTKLDGTPKGGIVVAVQDELEIPVRYIGIGEAASDLKEFNPSEFSGALFDTSVIEETDGETAHGERRRRRREESGAPSI